MLDRTEPHAYATSSDAGTTDQRALVQASRTDVPTLALAAALYGAFIAVTWFYHAIPWWLVLPLGAVIVCLQNSLQHETMHGYPTRWSWLNYLIAAPALSLWQPHGISRDDHLRHHRDEDLTDPYRDPESNYVAPETWARMSPLHRKVRAAMATLLGRVVIGPIYLAAQSALRLVQAIRADDRVALRHWSLHAIAVGILAWWIVGVCGIPLPEYVLLFAWPGTGLALVRSYAEHRWASDVPARTATVEAGPVMSFLFLNNNLHALHHAEPTLAWHQRPRRYRAVRNRLLGDSRYHLIDGYGTLVRRYLFEAKEPVLHPAARASRAKPTASIVRADTPPAPANEQEHLRTAA